MSIRVIVSGASGHMGRIVCDKVAADPDMELAAKVDPADGSMLPGIDAFEEEADVVIDFSHHSGTMSMLEACCARKLPVILCTTGQTEEELAAIESAADSIAIFRSANMSVGIAVLRKLVREAAAAMTGCDIEIVETHHNRKVDAPSGTALMLADAAREGRPELVNAPGRAGLHKREANEIGIQSVRMGNIVGIHEVSLGAANETITISHQAHDRALFADGALDAARFIAGKGPGIYDMDDMLAE